MNAQVCKWTFLGHAADDSAQTDVDGWQETFWRGIGLGIAATHVPPMTLSVRIDQYTPIFFRRVRG
jgi:hypothetical protein